MKLALHRSITFWSGILVMGFIVWAWRDSRDAESWCSWRGMELGADNCGVVLKQFPGRGGDEWRSGRAVWVAEHVQTPWFPPPFLIVGKNATPTALVIFIPFWMILLAAAGLWGGLLAWRVRRRRKEPRMNTDSHG